MRPTIITLPSAVGMNAHVTVGKKRDGCIWERGKDNVSIRFPDGTEHEHSLT